METRKCSGCGRELPFTNDYFNWQNKEAGRLRTICRECIREQKRKWYEQRKAENPEWHKLHLDKCRDYYESNKESCAAANREWRATHKRQRQDAENRGRERRCLRDPVFVWTNKARAAVRRAVLSKGVYDNHSGEFLHSITGLYSRELREYLFSTFCDRYGYAWDGVEPTHVDHIIPLCTESTIEGKKRLFDYRNLCLLKEADNRAKGTRLDWQRSAENIAKAYEEVNLPD